MSFLSKLCNDNESRVQDSADVTVGSLSDADLRKVVRSVLGDTYRLTNIVRHDGDIDLHLESERGDTVYVYKFFEAGHELVDDFKRELSATKLRPVSSYTKKAEDSKGCGRAQDSEGDFYSKKVWGADDSDIARVVRESNPILEHIGWGTNAKRSVDFRMMGDDEVAYVEIPVVAGMTLGDLRDALDPNNLPFPGIVEDSKGRGRAQDSDDSGGWVKRDSGHMTADLYVKEYDNMPDMEILGIRKSQGGPVVHFRVRARLLDNLGFDDLENTLYFTKFDSFPKAAAVADRIAEAHSKYYKSLSDIIAK